MGHIHERLGDLEKAEEYQDRAFAIMLKKLGPDQTEVATDFCELGDPEQEKEYHDGAVATREGKLSDRTAVNSQFRN